MKEEKSNQEQTTEASGTGTYSDSRVRSAANVTLHTKGSFFSPASLVRHAVGVSYRLFISISFNEEIFLLFN